MLCAAGPAEPYFYNKAGHRCTINLVQDAWLLNLRSGTMSSDVLLMEVYHGSH